MPGGGASLQAASSVNKQEPAVCPAACALSPGGRGASRRGQRKLDGKPGAVSGFARTPISGKGRGRRVPAARAGGGARSGARRRASPARPASWGLGHHCRRRLGGTPHPPSRRPAPSLALGLCHCTCPGARGAPVVRPGRAPRLAVICSGRGLAPGASGSLQAPPGRPRALGLTRLGYGAGEVGAGSLWGPSGALLAGSGDQRPPGKPGAQAAAGCGRECPPRALRPRSGRPSGIRPPAEHGWCKAAAATSFPPNRRGSPTERCPPRPFVAPASPRLLSVPGPGGLSKFGGLLDVTCPLPLDAPVSLFWL